jgi:tRNA(Ile)-lysidine synthase
MLDSFLRHVRAEALFSESDRLLLASSGGLDSTVLAYLFRAGGFEFGIAHVNFQLRGAESDADEEFVRSLAEQLGVECFVKHFATATEATERGESIQMAARRLRYDWLETVRHRAGFDYLVTAHHNDDRIETFLLHFLRGTGLRGLSSIPAAEGVLRRPLLYTDRATLAAYAEREQIDYREDSSNSSDTYDRNYLRHHVLPHLRQLEPGLTKRTTRNFTHLREELAILTEYIDAQRSAHCRLTDSGLRIDRRFLQSVAGGQTYLHHWLADYDFTPEQLRQALVARSGTRLAGAMHELVVGTDELLLRPRTTKPVQSPVALPGPGTYPTPDGGELRLEPTAGPPAVGERWTLYLPAARLRWPLHLRHWRPGDRLQPFGMEGRSKKLQDLFTDAKLDRAEREAAWLLCDADDRILWVIGLRSAESVRLTGAEKDLLRCHFRSPVLRE